MIRELIERAKADPAFVELHRRFATANVQNWLLEDEKALHFAVGAFAPGGGSIVEIGAFEGGSACFLAGGIQRRGQGRLTSIDPHLGAPPWLGTEPGQRTLEPFRRGTRHCGVADWIDVRIGDSTALAAIWPAEPIDAIFIDGDHSFLGAFKDFESWAPKLRPGGLVLIDDADDACLPELLEMIELVKTLGSVRYLDTIQGIAVFQRTDVPAWEMLDELGRAARARRTYRAWDLSFLHERSLPPHYHRSLATWTDRPTETAYQLCFLARCGPGAYGYTAATTRAERDFLHALSKDRGDGAVVAINARPRGLRALLGPSPDRFRAILCRPEEAKLYADRLLTGGVLIARHHEASDPQNSLRIRRLLIDAGLEGCGWLEGVHWGVRQPHHLSPEAVLEYAAGVA
ncbi:MAG TPA: class I SAM-dependent methyltransferase [Opitutaceae bacterium]|nr:class I SAM-dependent methyltransferase [Opitutaceae bacterium]